MACFSFDWTPADVARRTAAGQEAIHFPATGLTETPVRLPGCSGCPKAATHNPCSNIGVSIPFGESRYERVPVENRPTVEHLTEVMSAYWLLGRVHHNIIGDSTLYNLGNSGNNAEQWRQYEIVSASGTTLRIKGRNPKYYVVGNLRLNPEWPFPDPDTGLTSRLIPDSEVVSMPVGSVIIFNQPSVLAGKLQPHIVSLTPPASTAVDGVEFDIELSADISEAETPYDAYWGNPSGVYTCKVVSEILAPQTWLRLNATIETQFSKATAEITSAAVTELLDNADGSTRVIWPGMMQGGFTATVFRQDGRADILSDVECIARLETVQSGSGWTTTFDTTDLDFDTVVSKVLISYRPEAVAADTFRVPFAGSCSHAEKDLTGSYIHGTERHCSQAADATALDTFQDSCWQPKCNRFSLGLTGGWAGHFGDGKALPDYFAELQFWSSLWSRAVWLIEQGVAGVSSYRNFSWKRPANAGPSMGCLFGGFGNKVATTFVPTLSEDVEHDACLGRRETWTDGDGNAHQRIVKGAFYEEPHDYSADDGEVYKWTAGTEPRGGFFPEHVTGWETRTNALGASAGVRLKEYPERNIGHTSVASFAHGSSGMARTNVRHASSAAYVVANDVVGVDEAFAASIRERF